ncbi:hypothetical protein CMI37_22120 [Candidatus Pacearchaeota archaeon]|nr:hypothetical protein [Candidatus Pacearchaeota archaeon]|tara:strand:- start:4671 stop:5777 length:1107 start_codon:yes stop_codon:yes gene_type:complete
MSESLISFTCSAEKAYHCYENYGHFIRDGALWIYYYLEKKNLLHDPDHKLLVYAQNFKRSKRPIQMTQRHKNFLNKVFNSTIYTDKGEWEKMLEDRYPDGDHQYTEWSQKRSGHKLSTDNYYRLDAAFRRRVGTITRHGDDWGGDTAEYPKISVDGFRDHCLKAYGIKPKIKKRLLYVPREETTLRFLDDKKLEKMLRNFCDENDYEFVRWANNIETSIEQQIKMYSESEIIVGANGTDFVNSYWTNENQLLIEIVCADRIFVRGYNKQSLGALGGFSGFSAAFRSESISDHLLGLYGEDYPRNRGKQYRNWHIIRTPRETNKVVEGYECRKWYRHKCKIRFETSEENLEEIQDVISKWRATSDISIC